ncbi:Fe(2+) transporter FeoB [Candidatus Gugararchaeum adminiculabundum]|nr:Fe(2+) transporter FeoB [Candidatus Gugararchaeum adminiculabundum]
MGVHEKIREIEEEMARTQVNKATERHLGLLKAKLAKLKKEIIGGKGSKKTGSSGFDVKKSGDSTVVLIGLPSVGKSTILNKMTKQQSKVAAYAFTTLTVIPGIFEYKGAKIQILDLPGIISGAKEGAGRGREILSVARSADLIMIILDVFHPNIKTILDELEGFGIRLNQKPPNVVITKKQKGGITVNRTVKTTKLDDKTIEDVLGEYGMHSADVVIRQDVSVDEFIDVVVGNREYIPAITVLNKVDLVSRDYLKQVKFSYLPVAAEKNFNIDKLKDAVYDGLDLIRVYTKPRMGEADMKEPMIVRSGITVAEFCDRLHRDLRKNFKYAQIWGTSARFQGQKVGIEHRLKDGDIVTIVAR